MAEVIYDRTDQPKKIQQLLIGGGALYAVYDLKGSGTGVVGITGLRLVFMDQAFLRKQSAIVSLPYSEITAVGSKDSGKLILSSILGSSTLFVVAGDRPWTSEFRSNDKVHKAYDLTMRSLLQNLLSHERALDAVQLAGLLSQGQDRDKVTETIARHLLGIGQDATTDYLATTAERDLVIHFATWGSRDAADVTDVLRSKIVEGKPRIRACSEELVGGEQNDPMKGVGKSLRVVYSYGSQVDYRIIPEQIQLSLP